VRINKHFRLAAAQSGYETTNSVASVLSSESYITWIARDGPTVAQNQSVATPPTTGRQ